MVNESQSRTLIINGKMCEIQLILLFNVHSYVSKFDRDTNRTKRAKREREPSRVPVRVIMKAQKKRKICQITIFNDVDHRSNALF